MQAQSIEKELGLKSGKGPFNTELFGGSPDDNNAYFFYDGAMSVLEPYIKSGKLVVRSGQTGMKTVGTLRWDGAVAQARMDNILSAYYTDKRVDAVLSPYDGLSIGILSSLKGVGYGKSDLPMPVVTGQDAEVPSIKSIIAHEQRSTIFKDTRDLAKVAVSMVDAMLGGGKPEVNDTKTYNNGVKVVPSFLLKPVPVDLSNYKQILGQTSYRFFSVRGLPDVASRSFRRRGEVWLPSSSLAYDDPVFIRRTRTMPIGDADRSRSFAAIPLVLARC